MDRQTTVEAIKFVKSIWNTHGVSREVRCDRGPAFRDQFLDDLEEMGVDVVHSSPYHPQGNGLAERAVQEVKKYLKKNGALQGPALDKMMLHLNSVESSIAGAG